MLFLKPQRTRKTWNRQPNLELETTGKIRTPNAQISRRKEIIKIRAKISEKEMKETIVKFNKLKAGSLRGCTKLTNL